MEGGGTGGRAESVERLTWAGVCSLIIHCGAFFTPVLFRARGGKRKGELLYRENAWCLFVDFKCTLSRSQQQSGEERRELHHLISGESVWRLLIGRGVVGSEKKGHSFGIWHSGIINDSNRSRRRDREIRPSGF